MAIDFKGQLDEIRRQQEEEKQKSIKEKYIQDNNEKLIPQGLVLKELEEEDKTDRELKKAKEDNQSARRQRNFWIVILVILVGVGGFLFMSNSGAYKSTNNQTTTCLANATCTNTCAAPTIPDCPSLSCGNTSVVINPIINLNSTGG